MSAESQIMDTLRAECLSLKDKYTGVMYSFLLLSEGEHKELFAVVSKVVKLVAEEAAPKYSKSETFTKEDFELQNKTFKTSIAFMEGAINLAKKEHQYFDLEKIKEVEEQAKEIHEPGCTRGRYCALYSDGELVIHGKMCEPPLPGLANDKFVFPSKSQDGNTSVLNEKSEALYALRAKMKTAITKPAEQ